MKFTEIELKQFRNFKDLKLTLSSGLNVFRGQNGQGKTNLIEALYLLTHGRSFRTNSKEDLMNKFHPGGFFIKSQIIKNDLDYELRLAVDTNKKKLLLNQQAISAPQLKQKFNSLLFSPDSLLIIKESSQKRRELIDELCMSLFPQFAQLYSDCKKLLKQKNNILKQLRDDQIDCNQGHDINRHLTRQYLEKSARLVEHRLQALKVIEPILLEEFLQIMDNHYGNVSVQYSFSGKSFSSESSQELLNAMYNRWLELKDREIASGLCLVGPHKHNIDFLFNGQEARFFCSQGQQRAIVLAFKMAQIKLHYRAHKEYPILLLDDVLSELDQEKQTRFVNYLQSTDAQIFLTTTDATRVPAHVEKSVFEVENGLFWEKKGFVTGGLSV